MADVAKTEGRSSRWLRVLLFASLALNLLVLGIAVGFALKGPPERHGSLRGDPVLPYTRAFEEDQRREVWRALRQSLPRDGGEMRARFVADYALALDLLRSDTFDAARMEALLTGQVARGTEVRMQGQKVLTAYLAGMSPQDRLAYADRLEAELDRLRQRALRPHDRGPDGKERDGG
jgi:uncharacterized membrane protein